MPSERPSRAGFTRAVSVSRGCSRRCQIEPQHRRRRVRVREIRSPVLGSVARAIGPQGQTAAAARLPASRRWNSKTVAANLGLCSSPNPRYFEMPRSRILLLSAATLTLLNISVVARAQYPSNQGYYPPPCQAVTPSPVRGAARGAAGGAMIGAISGNAGRGAAIGAAFGGVRSAVRRGSARSAGACY